MSFNTVCDFCIHQARRGVFTCVHFTLTLFIVIFFIPTYKTFCQFSNYFQKSTKLVACSILVNVTKCPVVCKAKSPLKLTVELEFVSVWIRFGSTAFVPFEVES